MVDPCLLTAPSFCSALWSCSGLSAVVLLRAWRSALTAEVCNGKVNLSWMYPGPQSYQINRNGSQLVTGYADTSYIDTNVTNGITYSYIVTNSSYSSSVSASPAALPGRPPGSTVNTNGPLYQNLIGLFLMNDGQAGRTDGGPAEQTLWTAHRPPILAPPRQPGYSRIPPSCFTAALPWPLTWMRN